MNTLIRITVIAALSTLSFGVLAHGDAEDSARSAMPPEQKAWGIGASEDQVDRELVIRMNDNMRFTPDHFEVAEGETLKLVIKNEGEMLHELVLGTAAELKEHAALMEKFPGMEHDEPYMAHVAAGQTQTLIWTFNRAGRFDFACLLPGHFQAGMVGGLEVSTN
ncbi:cupredoxin domain-containing protein [Halopseudomonas bauzanensis]|uniref:Plastocyanin n=1 Tax=Halopseudomonas bauzanensis TaxID=653930 RepID=A0A1H9SKB8_9GAMM|nr:cupredoxin family protein [Halopseudomonas bauzanensis]TKA92927.1 plastocyanin [Halopseudomonas bauzanensis]SER84699.1 Copper binding protein, plastocyanin/azurin family [Halopseudomonas bauzanensis]SFL95433.1 Copper binding protein, plastocyanin/azurin family [Halopseudomonas bauzanensis]